MIDSEYKIISDLCANCGYEIRYSQSLGKWYHFEFCDAKPTTPQLPVYVEVGEYESARNLARLNARDVTKALDKIAELQTENDKLLELLRQWQNKANDGLIDDTFNGVRSPELTQLITDTEAQLGE